MYLELGFYSVYISYSSAEETTSWNQFVLDLYLIDRFRLTSEGTELYILTVTVKTIKAHNRHMINLFAFFYQKDDIVMYFILFQTLDFKDTRDRTKRSRIFVCFRRFFILASPPPVPGISDSRHNRSQHLQNVDLTHCMEIYQ